MSKSTTQFIEWATDRKVQIVGHGVQSGTTDIQTFRTTHPDDDFPVVLVDTPGSDEENYTVTQLISEIAVELKKT